MRILFVSAEVVPFSKTGGLADVAGALPQALVARGHEVLVVSPWYRTLKGSPLWIGDVAVPFDGAMSSAGVGTLERDGVRYAFVGHADFDRDALYGYADDARRFGRFTRAVPSVAERVDFVPDIVHANDWHSGYLPLLLDHGWHLPPGFPGLPSVFTVHNVQYQGGSDLEATVYWLRLPLSAAEGYMNHFGRANAMQAAAGHAWRVTTVSPSYADEIRTPEFGYGLDGTFAHLGTKLVGILNGIDTEVWDPRSDATLSQRFDRTSLDGKALAREELCRDFGLDPQRPLLGLVSRFAEQKGIDLLLEASDTLIDQGWSLLLLGSGEPELERWTRELFRSRPGRVSGSVGFDEALAHRIYAGCDALAIPSRFEPCGLSQLIAMRYGTLPIARATGGLRDTIDHGRTGFLFEHATAEGMRWAGGEAIARFGTPAWRAMMETAMDQDFSWNTSAEQYEALYRSELA
jgi:starch synthase